MVEQVTKFVASDGKQFDTFEEAVQHEERQELVALLEHFGISEFDHDAAAAYLLKTYILTKRSE